MCERCEKRMINGFCVRAWPEDWLRLDTLGKVSVKVNKGHQSPHVTVRPGAKPRHRRSAAALLLAPGDGYRATFLDRDSVNLCRLNLVEANHAEVCIHRLAPRPRFRCDPRCGVNSVQVHLRFDGERRRVALPVGSETEAFLEEFVVRREEIVARRLASRRRSSIAASRL